MNGITLSDREFADIRGLLYRIAGINLGAEKKALVCGRLEKRLLQTGAKSYRDYFSLATQRGNERELTAALDLLTTNETYFFREPKHYEFLEKELPARKSKQPLAIWSAAASFGDEAYSTAMLLTDLQTSGRVTPGWSILGTDISHRVLLAAKAAVYPVDRLRNVSPERLRRYCLRGEGDAEGQVLLQDKLRENVSFGQLNLCQDYSGLGPFDVIFLRNVLIYFDLVTKAQVVDRALALLRPGGLFFLGTAEGRVKCDTPLLSLQPGISRKPE